ncbi:MAG TPA: T9SS type A sorting domain-containing protein [Bacteroidales bacterium]|nr:T9SS type A sorting domain-containing protein [Bacteroidales bacterium]HPT01378.1 T9SS type A sorting domain-containing protein [Bacteroidales bacterium]
MKKITLFMLFLLVLGTTVSKGQIVLSSCTAPDSIVAKYTDDADRLALGRFYRNALPYADSVSIPQAYSDTALKALLAVYNATELPERDTVVELYDIHTCMYALRRFAVIADSNQSWMQQLRNGVIPTGEPAVDSLMQLFNLSVESYSSVSYQGNHTVHFTSDKNYNILALVGLWNSVPGFYSCLPHGFMCPSMSLKDSIYSDHVELTYSHGWGDCSAGCLHRYWKFNVYFDCSVGFAGSYGVPVPIGMEDHFSNEVSVLPNPFSQGISVNGITPPFLYSIRDMSGKVIISEECTGNEIENLDVLKPGFYILSVNDHGRIFRCKIIKAWPAL